MREEPADGEGYVAVDRASILRIARAVEVSRRCQSRLALACDELLALADDFHTDAVRRLKERGASEAQVEGYERAYHEARRALEAAGCDVSEAERELADSVDALVHG